MNPTKSSDIRIRTFEFGVSVIQILRKIPRDEASRVIINQFIRAATSIGANVAEAGGAGTRLDFKRFYEISLKSARECDYWLRLLVKTEYMNSSTGATLSNELNEIISMLVSAIKRLKEPLPSPTSDI